MRDIQQRLLNAHNELEEAQVWALYRCESAMEANMPAAERMIESFTEVWKGKAARVFCPQQFTLPQLRLIALRFFRLTQLSEHETSC